MGLDWNPESRPKPGFEAEFAAIRARMDDVQGREREADIARFQAISDAPFETIGAPRVGADPEADEWLRGKLRAAGREREFDKKRAEMEGYYVLDLVPDSPGLPLYSNYAAGYEGIDRYSFRAQFLDDVRDIIGNELHERAWAHMDAGELKAYGEALLEAGRRFAGQHGLETLEHQRELPDDEEGPVAQAHIIFSAAAWCLWWAERGHGLEPYF